MRKTILIILVFISIVGCGSTPTIRPSDARIQELDEEIKREEAQPPTPENRRRLGLLRGTRNDLIALQNVVDEKNEVIEVAEEKAEKNAEKAAKYTAWKWAAISGGSLLLLGIGLFIYLRR